MRAGVAWMMLAVSASAALAQEEPHGPANLNPVQTEGRRLYQQSCGVCHTRPTITAPLFGPQLSKLVVEGPREAQAKKQIAEGSPNMPGFRYNYTPSQIDAVVEFLRLLPPPAAAPSNPATEARPAVAPASNQR